MNESIATELNLLLNNFWILKDKRPHEYYLIKNKLKILREIANNKLGCDIICNSKLIKLEKTPIFDDNTYMIEEFDNELDYVIFVILLLFLEDKAIEEQFILSNFTEYVTNVLASIEGKIKPDWNKYKDRKSLVDVLKYATSMGIIKLRDGNDAMYADNAQTEALYENTTLSHYVMRSFKFDVYSATGVDDFIHNERIEFDPINYKRYMTYRGLLFYPNIIYDELELDVVQYLKNMRGRIAEDIEKYLESELILSKNMAFLSLEGEREKDLFPNYRKSITDIILLINTYLKEMEVTSGDKVIIDKNEFKKILVKVHEENKEYFSKEFRDSPINKFMEIISKYMVSYKLLKIEDDNYIFNPICFLISGNYKRKEEAIEDNNYEFLMLDLEE